ncbi:zinc finger protein 660-like [Chrysoperla carnea]|uniref:zinc finger protein 660-like n=1 Tax=Chrysoperla carnea TaxID=189513 RepID=UPI001D0818ED|nr:zinc finger protein 660-like [Chrysoperla carnea]
MKQHDKYKCITCNENYADKNNLLKHKRLGHETHGIEQQYKCELCETILSSKILLNVHLRKHKTKKNHLENSLQLNKYKKESLNNKHIKNQPAFDTNMNDLQYICTMCKKMFGKKSQLNQHRERVHGKHKYHCSLCSHQSNNKTNLMQHIRLHLTHEREFVCDQCGKSFYRNSTLKEHKILQHNEKDQQFACEICGKLFKRNCEVSRHLLTHSEERPHTCSQCGQSYKRKTHLQRHQLATHGTTTNSNQRHVQRLLKNSNGELIPSKQYKEINSSLEIQAKDLIPINKIPTDNIPMYNFMNNCEEFMYSNSEELWIDNKSNNIVVEYITDTDNQTNTSEAEQYLNQSTLHLDHIDAKDLIVLSTEQMFNVNVVEDDNVSNKDMLPQYLRTFQYL